MSDEAVINNIDMGSIAWSIHCEKLTWKRSSALPYLGSPRILPTVTSAISLHIQKFWACQIPVACLFPLLRDATLWPERIFLQVISSWPTGRRSGCSIRTRLSQRRDTANTAFGFAKTPLLYVQTAQGMFSALYIAGKKRYIYQRLLGRIL